jgi:hypothetical protein
MKEQQNVKVETGFTSDGIVSRDVADWPEECR